MSDQKVKDRDVTTDKGNKTQENTSQGVKDRDVTDPIPIPLTLQYFTTKCSVCGRDRIISRGCVCNGNPLYIHTAREFYFYTTNVYY